jgi:hypothetical protein
MTTPAAMSRIYHALWWLENRERVCAARRKRWREDPKLRKKIVKEHRAWRARQRAKGLRPS